MWANQRQFSNLFSNLAFQFGTEYTVFLVDTCRIVVLSRNWKFLNQKYHSNFPVVVQRYMFFGEAIYGLSILFLKGLSIAAAHWKFETGTLSEGGIQNDHRIAENHWSIEFRANQRLNGNSKREDFDDP